VNMHVLHKWTLWILVLVALSIAFVGCQSGDSEVEATTPTSTVTPRDTPTEEIQPEATSVPTAAEEGAGEPEADGTSPELLVPTPAIFPFEREGGDDTLMALGDPEAPVTVVEFFDYQCPYCLIFHQQTWPALKEQYIETGRVYYVVKDFPLTSLHPEAPKAAEAAHCAAEQDAYWEMHDRLFEGQAEWVENPEYVALFKGFAGELGLDQTAFDQCLDGGSQTDRVQADQDEGLALGVGGTPIFFIAGYPFSGALPIEFFDQAVTLAENGQLRNAIADAIARAQAEQEQQAQPTLSPVDVPIGDAPMKGDPDAPITIVEYSDYQCPYCGRYVLETLTLLRENYIQTGKVRYFFKDFPLTSMHPQAVEAAEAARCAGELGGDEAYWDMHDRLFAGQAEWSGQAGYVEVFKGYAGELGLTQADFDQCLDSGRYVDAVQADMMEGAGFGVTGVPAFFINGQPLVGAQPYQVFAQMIEALLAGE
jgi:protein-disulfide isomerase